MSEQTAHVLIVEDEEAHAELVCRAFESHHVRADRFRLTVVGSLAEAKAHLSTSCPDLIIADLRLPDGQGTDLLCTHEEHSPFPLVVMTSHGDEQMAVEAIKGGALDYVVKSPQTLNDMPRIAESALREWGHIVQRRKAEKALRESEERYRTVANFAHDWEYWIAPDGKFVYVSPACERVTGYGAEEFMRDPKLLETIIHPDDRDEIVNHLHEGELSKEDKHELEFRIVTASGEERWISHRCQRVYSREGAHLGRRGSNHDITERRRTEEVTTRLNRQVKSILESAGEGIFGLNLEGKHTFVNSTAARLLGYEVADLIGRGSHQKWHHARLDGTPYPCEECPIYETLQDGKTHSGEEYFWRKDGTGFPVDFTSTPIHEGGAVVGAVVTFTDITQRKLGEEALRESEEKYRLLVENANDAIFIVQDEKIPFANPMTRALSGYSADELRQIPFEDIVHPEDRAMVLDRRRRRLAGEVLPRTFTFRIIRKDGTERMVMPNTVLIRWEGRPATLNFLRDITDQSRLEGQVRQSQKMEAIGTLAGGIAHDFNNILGAIVGYTEMALMMAPRDDKLRLFLHNVLKASERAGDLVRQILTFSRHAETELKPLRVGSVLKEVVKLLRPSLPSFIEIRQNIATDKDIIMADLTQIHQVVMNLCTNAHHAMKESGGVLEIELRNANIALGNTPPDADEGRSKTPHLELPPGEYVQLSVGDTGYGIEERILPRIFDPFFTTKKIGEGTGMGLAVTHGIVKRHGGTIQVESRVGKGTTFHVFFPMHEEAREPVEAETPPVVPPGKGKILFVDDEAMLVEVGSLMLSSLGFEVVISTSSLEALELFRSKPCSFDLAILDMAMPKMTGLDLAREMLQLRPEMLIILCTGHSELVDSEKVRSMGIRELLMKPLCISKLAQAVKTTMER